MYMRESSVRVRRVCACCGANHGASSTACEKTCMTVDQEHSVTRGICHTTSVESTRDSIQPLLLRPSFLLPSLLLVTTTTSIYCLNTAITAYSYYSYYSYYYLLLLLLLLMLLLLSLLLLRLTTAHFHYCCYYYCYYY